MTANVKVNRVDCSEERGGPELPVHPSHGFYWAV